ncbi:trypco2 family protein [Loktanella sp. M215]|uniref:trypco2 family protein n=1 Tax=Loktanella sp. M215 TaxID=2675431 RepID=UPI001F3A512E|nr:hypothetical protein [Loktanella sp. M215]
MDLKDFIKETISGIIEATNDLQDQFADAGILINPPVYGDSGVYEEGSSSHRDRAIQKIDFDVAVTVASETGGDVGAKVRIVSVEAGGAGKHSRSNEEVSRVKFSIPLTLRPTDAEKRNRKEHNRQWNRRGNNDSDPVV